MAIPYELIAASKPFRILVGPDKKEFTMHTELLGRMSKPLRTLVKGDMKEAKEGVAEWPEIDEGTFIRFWEFAYTGDYKAAEPFIDAPAPSDLANGNAQTLANRNQNGQYYEEEQEDGYHNYNYGYGSRTATTTSKREMWKQFQNQFSTEQDKAPAEQPNKDPSANYSEALLSHARLYAFADYYCVDALMALCLRKLHRTLKVFSLHGGARVTDVAQLVDYAYKNTVSGKAAGGEPDGLRSMLATYAACKVEGLWDNIYFQDVLESGEVAKAIIGQLMRRLK
ncbi:hypothetical protein F4820DRAFT_84924 [Hypoxylon rubiginosum]|uniref:Uncharacterized protein n=1 Tax=Hypoxylon rubiginosum TaxID=110542 RepID=A0ACB9YNM5_9PEZI|nr:hypothetical protein F4820DRAFT_84924 [Hypoxylon rubiginosum]